MKTRHPFPFISSPWCQKCEAGTEPLNLMASMSNLPRIPSLKVLSYEPLLDPTVLLAHAFPVPRLPDCQAGWQCPGVKAGSCISSLRVLCWPSASPVHLHLLLSPFHDAVRCCFVPRRKPILFYSYQRRNRSGATRKNRE